MCRMLFLYTISKCKVRYIRKYFYCFLQEELEQTKKLVQEFQKPGGQGETLQAELLQRANEKENWVRLYNVVQSIDTNISRFAMLP